MPKLSSLLSLCASATLLGACVTTLESEPPATSITAMAGLGPSSFVVTASDPQARAWFAQGLQLAYAFEHGEAVRVFRAAAARDPSCAMCAWGVAYALGPNINNPDRGPQRDIRRYLAKAQAAAAGVTPKERALIDALALRFGRADEQAQQRYEAMGSALCSTRGKAKQADPKELAYAAAMSDVVQRYPDDPDVVTLYADAQMNTLSWEWWDPKTGQPNGRVGDVIERLAEITKRYPQHTGALHFYVHVAEHSPRPQQAEAAADALGTVAPEAPHLVHMGSHIYKNIGRFADGSRANEQALEVQKRFDATLNAQGVKGGGWWNRHHLHFLWYAALMEGRLDLSLSTARDMAKRYGRLGDAAGEYTLMLPLATLVRLERWQDVLAEPMPGEGLGVLRTYVAFARGMALLHTGQLVPAKAEAVELARLRALPAVQAARMWGEDTPVKLVALSEALLMGSLARTERRFDEAVTQLRKAADLDDELGTDPPMLGGGARLALAGALMDAGRLDEAGKEMAEALRLNGPSAWSHQALAQLAAARGNAAESQRHADQARLAWGRAQGADLPRL
ncbi:hypothetical protein [Roseateles paludis]|uniref:Tetratricopeptide repeat protein n=1 Tax=Roseateles paludis TaxID=3145238 RepID=A0ABV0G076_9BURK